METKRRPSAATLIDAAVDLESLLAPKNGWSNLVELLERTFDQTFIKDPTEDRLFLVSGNIRGRASLRVSSSQGGLHLKLAVSRSLADALAARYAYTVHRAINQ